VVSVAAIEEKDWRWEGSRQPYLTIGRWTYSQPAMMATAIRKSVLQLRAHLLNRLQELRLRLVAQGVDVVIIDPACGHSAGVIRALRAMKDNWPKLPGIAGKVVTAEGAEALIAAGRDI
jgi:hypothetical protein